MEWLKGKVGAAKADGAAAAGAAAAGAAAAGRTLPAQKPTTLERYFDEFKDLPYIAVIQELYKTGVWEPYFQPPRFDGQNWDIYVTYIPIFRKANNTENHYHFFMDERGPGFSLKVNNKHTDPGHNRIKFKDKHNLKYFEDKATVEQVWGEPGGGAASPGTEATAGGPQRPPPKAAKKQDPKYSNRDMFAFSPECTQDSSPQDSSTSSPARKKTKPGGAGGGYAITKKKMPRKKKSRKLRSKKKKTRKKARKKSRRKKYTNK